MAGAFEGHALGVVAAGVGDDAAGDLRGRELQNLVGRAANLEGPDRLKAFGFEVDLSVGSVARDAGERGANERGLDGDAGDAGGCGADFGEGDEGGHVRNCKERG